MNTQNPKTWFNIFRVGRHTARNGEIHDYPEQALLDLVAGYDGKTDAAPIVVGHPETHSPAYGWIAELRMKDGVLQARARDVQEPFLEAVRTGAYRKISIALKRLEDGALRLLHVGFLGGSAPAIKGLGEVSWSEEEINSRYEYAYLTESANTEQQFARQAKEAAQHLAMAEYRAFEAEMQAKGIVNPLGADLTRAIVDSLRAGNACFNDDKPLHKVLQERLLNLSQSIDFREYTQENLAFLPYNASDQIQQKARAFQTENPAISWPDAVAHVTSHSKG